MLAAGPLRVVQQIGIVFQHVPGIAACRQRAALTHHEPPAGVCSLGGAASQASLPLRAGWKEGALDKEGPPGPLPWLDTGSLQCPVGRSPGCLL